MSRLRRALVTGGRGGIGSAIVAALGRLEGGGPEVRVLDLPEFDVGDPEAWHALEGRYDAAFLNAGIGIRINALCPGFADAPIVGDELRRRLRVPLIDPAFVADAALRAATDAETGRAWVVQPNRVEPFRFPGVPGPR